MQKQSTKDVEFEDQQGINRFNKLFTRSGEVEAEIKAKKVGRKLSLTTDMPHLSCNSLKPGLLKLDWNCADSSGRSGRCLQRAHAGRRRGGVYDVLRLGGARQMPKS